MNHKTDAVTPMLDGLIAADPDLVDRIFDYILAEVPQMAAHSDERVQQLKAAVRAEFKGEECYIASRPATARQEMVAQVLALFNGRNASEVARRLQISRASVYRVLKQPGGRRPPPDIQGQADAVASPTPPAPQGSQLEVLLTST